MLSTKCGLESSLAKKSFVAAKALRTGEKNLSLSLREGSDSVGRTQLTDWETEWSGALVGRSESRLISRSYEGSSGSPSFSGTPWYSFKVALCDRRKPSGADSKACNADENQGYGKNEAQHHLV